MERRWLRISSLGGVINRHRRAGSASAESRHRRREPPVIRILPRAYNRLERSPARVIRNPQSAYNHPGPMPTPSLVLQTTYAELMDRCAQAAFGETFTAEGVFTPKTVKGRRYWYFQSSSKDGRVQKYVGPETSGLLKQIEDHRRAKGDETGRCATGSSGPRWTLFGPNKTPAPLRAPSCSSPQPSRPRPR